MAPQIGKCDASPAPVGIFVYGTLRHDSTAPTTYTRSFNEGCVSVPATLRDARLLFDGYYPYVVLEEGASTVAGMLVFPPDLDRKVREGDKIENEGVMYHRVVVTVFPEDEKEGVQAYVYVKQCPSAVAVPVETGDWVTADKEELAVASLMCMEPSYAADAVRRAVIKANSDLRLAKSMLKWGIV